MAKITSHQKEFLLKAECSEGFIEIIQLLWDDYSKECFFKEITPDDTESEYFDAMYDCGICKISSISTLERPLGMVACIQTSNGNQKYK